MKDPILENLAYSLKSVTESLEQWITVKEFYQPVMEKLLALGESVGISSSWKSIYLRATGNGPFLTQIVRILRTAGWATKNSPPAANQPEWNAYFRKTVQVPDEDNADRMVDKELTINFTFSSTVCTRVKVGTELKEVDIYEVRCGDLPADSEAKADSIIEEIEGPEARVEPFDEEIPY